MSEPIDIVFSFDTTGSMYPCLAQVRRKIAETSKRLFKDVPNLRIGIIAHGDYCDSHIYVTKHLALTSDPNAVTYFVENVEATGGGDWPECYELVLHEAHSKVEWRPDSKRVLAMIGDAIPHPPAHNPKRLDWRKELDTLTSKGVLVHGVQALHGNREADNFYAEVANRTGGQHLRLAQFNEATELFLAVVYQQQSPEALEQFEQELTSTKRMTRSMTTIFDKLNKRDSKGRYRKVDARAVAEGRFQQIEVDYDQPIKALVEANGLIFKTGRGFYEFTKKETIQAYKEVVILDKETGDMYQGAAAREVLGLPEGSIDIKPTYDKTKYTVFVQSTSNNRKLIGGTTFLYEAEPEYS